MASAQVLLPMGSFAETSGTYVNVEGRWQEFQGCAQPVGEARPGWKILRVLGNLLGLDGFDYVSSDGRPRGAARTCAMALATTDGSGRGAQLRSERGGSTTERRDLRRRCASCAARRRCRRTRDWRGPRLSRAWPLLVAWWSGSIPPELQSAIIVTAADRRRDDSIVIAVAMLTLAERKVIGYMQLRIGPNRVSFFGLPILRGLAQPFADVIKLLLKEIIVPAALVALPVPDGAAASCWCPRSRPGPSSRFRRTSCSRTSMRASCTCSR